MRLWPAPPVVRQEPGLCPLFAEGRGAHRSALPPAHQRDHRAWRLSCCGGWTPARLRDLPDISR